MAVHGQAGFANPAANQLQVTTQNGVGTSHSAINWQSFSIAPGASTSFQQPSASSTVINRVVTNTPSSLFGTLSSNGKVVLVNQSGIAVGAGALIDTAGFTASALRMTDADALSGRLRFGDSLGGSTSGITVEGRITARNGDVVLVAPNIDVGAGALLQAPNGSTVLAAGQQVEITGRGLEGISLLVQAPGDTARNLGSLQGDAAGIFAGTLHHSGAIQATTASMEGGTVVLKASGDAYVEGAGTIKATGTRGGSVDVLGNRVAVTDQASVDVSGANGGGTIRIGGDYQGRNPGVPNARISYLGAEASLLANATSAGNGGKIIVWADDITRTHGTIAANANGATGDGGFVETSGHRFLDVAGSRVTASAAGGKAGTWLLDPADVFIVNGPAATAPVNLSGSTPFEPTSGVSAAFITDGVISQALDSTDVTITTVNNGSPGSGAGLINFDPFATGGGGTGSGAITITKTSTSGTVRNLTLTANDNIVFLPGSIVFQDASAANGNGLSINFNSASGAVRSLSGSTVTLSGLNNEVSAAVLNGKVWQNDGVVNLNGLSVVRLPLSTVFATFDNRATLNINSGSAWSFLSNSGTQGGLITNSGTVNVDGTNGGTATAWEAQFSNQPGGTLSLAANKFLSMQNMGTIAGSVVVNTASELRISETHGGARTFNAANFSGNGRITVKPGVTTTFNNSSGSFGALNLNGSVLNQSGTLNVQNYLQTGGSSAFSGAGNLSVTSGFTHTGGTFNPGGNVNIAQASGNLVFTDSLNAASIALSSNAGALTIASAQTSSGSMSLSAATGLTINAPLNAGTTFNAATAGPASVMTVNNVVVSGAAMNVNLAGGLTVQSAGSQAAELRSTAGGQTIQARYVEVLMSGSAQADINNDVGLQTITTTGVNGTGDGVLVFSSGGGAFIASTGSQTITVNNADRMRVVGGTGSASVSTANGPQTIVLQGTGQNSLVVGSATAAGGSQLDAFSQSITAGQAGELGSIVVQGGVADTRSRILSRTGAQTIAAANSISLTGGTGVDLNSDSQAATATIDGSGTSQSITAGATLSLTAGSSGSDNQAGVRASGNQSIAANRLQVTGGAGGGGVGIGNRSSVNANGNQNIVLGAGGLAITGGGGSQTDNAAQVYQLGTSGTSQTITLNGGGSITAQGGSSLMTNVGGATHGSRALIQSDGDSQTINFTAGGAIDLTGGTNGSRAYAQIYASNGSQSITGPSTIHLTGGASGGFATEGNFATINAQTGAQTISAGNIVLQGGTSGIENRANINASVGDQSIAANSISIRGGSSGQESRAGISASQGNQTLAIGSGGLSLTGGSGSASERKNYANVFQGGTGKTQTITVGGGGDISLQGGSSAGTNVGLDNGSFAYITSDGAAQRVEFSAPGSVISVTGGSVGSLNYAGFASRVGSQTIRGTTLANAPTLLLTGGSGGVAGEDNSAGIGSAGLQTISAATAVVHGGAGGLGNFAFITAPVQSLGFTGNVSLLGGDNGDANGGARIGGRGVGNTDLHLDVGGNLNLAGGSTSGVAVGANSAATGANSRVVVDVAGDIVMTPSATQGVRIGASAAAPQTGSVAIMAGGDVILNGGTGTARAAIRSLGNVAISADFLSIDGPVSGSTVDASGSSGVTIGSVGQISASAASGDAIQLVTGAGNFNNMGGPTALNVSTGARWLVFSNDPALDTLGGLVAGFNQYNTVFGASLSPQASGNGFVYRAPAPPVEVQPLPAEEASKEVLVTFLDLFGKALEQKVQEDTQDKKEKDALVTEEVCR